MVRNLSVCVTPSWNRKVRCSRRGLLALPQPCPWSFGLQTEAGRASVASPRSRPKRYPAYSSKIHSPPPSLTYQSRRAQNHRQQQPCCPVLSERIFRPLLPFFYTPTSPVSDYVLSIAVNSRDPENFSAEWLTAFFALQRVAHFDKLLAPWSHSPPPSPPTRFALLTTLTAENCLCRGPSASITSCR